jgi:formylglycine-generating enzyme required for sulfatase activity
MLPNMNHNLSDYVPGKDVADAEWLNAIAASEEFKKLIADQSKSTQQTFETADRIRVWLTNLIQRGALSPKDRQKAGDLLGELGDPRFEKSAWFLPAETLLGFVHIPAGKFWMGNGEEAYHADLPGYYMGRYPVTVAQFKAFINSTGFIPGNGECITSVDNHPVIWVNWYEAMAYCEWIGKQLQHIAGNRQADESLDQAEKDFWTGILNKTLIVTLPSELEWEKAARGTDGRTYPWGEVIDPQKANYKETGLGWTNPVGCFPQGNSPYGIADMSGNVWNWLRSLMGKDVEHFEFNYPYDPQDGREDPEAGSDVLRGMRGGAFLVEPRRATCYFRDGVPPDARDDGDGFRLVVTPV